MTVKKIDQEKITEIIDVLELLEIPFAGLEIESNAKKYHISPFAQVSISGIGPIFYFNKNNQQIYTLLQRRYKDSFQWWFPGGYVELPPRDNFFKENFNKIKDATIGQYYENAKKIGWQKALKDINDPQKIAQILNKHQINWPKDIDYNWQQAWQREVLEETGIDLDQFPDKLIFDFGNNDTFMIGSEPDRLINIDGKFCGFLGELEISPAIMPDHETEELRWISLDEISFNKINYVAFDKILNLYTASLIEASLHKLICYNIQKFSLITNPFTNQKISRFNTPQNLQSFLILAKIKPNEAIKKFLEWEFGELDISKNTCGPSGNELYKITLEIIKDLA